MFNRLKIGARLNLGFGLVLALLCAMAGVSAWQMGRLFDEADYYAVNLVPSFDVETRVAVGLGDLRRFEYRHITATNAAEKDKVEAHLAEIHKALGSHLDRYAKELVSDEEDRQALEAVRTALAAYTASWDKIRPLSREAADDAAKTEQVQTLVLGESSQAYEAVQGAVSRWFDYNKKLSDARNAEAKATYDTARVSLAAMTLAALVLGVTAAALITRSITGPIQRAVTVASTVAAGDLSSRIQVQGSDETAQLLQALAQMNQNLARIVGEVRQGSDSIATGSNQIAMGNTDLSQRTEQQASNLQQTAASMEQLAETVRANAATATHANQVAGEASSAANKGGELVGHVVATMQDIAQSSRRIADIIGVIDGIAFQTNILALNAAVEAARAGEQGRGFAVVAGEVRLLAQRSAEAAREIKSLIGASVEKVEAGTRQADDAGASMQEIVAQVQRVSQLIGDISRATTDQSEGISQVGHAVTQLDQVTQQNAALVEESAAAAESLRQQATHLTDTVGAFRLA